MERQESMPNRLYRFWIRARWRWHGLQVFALVGKSGTGKSFRSALVADKHGIEVILDDGLLIAGGKILAGHSAKREEHFFAATKTALLVDPEHRRAIASALRKGHFHRILILGTSERMIAKICGALELPLPMKTVKIEEIATREEIEAALRDRSRNGRHVIPLPMIEVKRSYPKMLVESFTVWLQGRWRFLGGKRAVEKSIVRPRFSGKGDVTVSEAALSQMILHCIAEHAPQVRTLRVRVARRSSGYGIKVDLAVPRNFEISPALQQLHDYIVSEIEAYSGIVIAQLSIMVKSVKTASPALDQPS